jgi:hypothetical protein
MHYYFDESGDFAFPEGRYDVYVQAAVICPDSLVDKVEHYVDNLKAALGVDELHAAELSDDQLIEICRFLGNGALQLVGQTTDTQVMTGEQISAHRREQAALLGQNFDQYKRAGGGWAGAEAWYTRLLGCSRRGALARDERAASTQLRSDDDEGVTDGIFDPRLVLRERLRGAVVLRLLGDHLSLPLGSAGSGTQSCSEGHGCLSRPLGRARATRVRRRH